MRNGSSFVIEASGVGKSYGDQVALTDIDLAVEPGVVVGVIGPSGCGKTTLIRLLTGITGPSAGELEVFGRDPRNFTTADRRRFGYMPQLPVLFPNLSVWGNLTFVASVYGMSVRRRRAALMELLDLVDLVDHRHKKLADCSGGMQRRLTLAATLVHDPELLYLDEPTAGVDPILRDRFWNYFRSLRDQGRTIVVPTQYVGEAVSCDIVAVMAAGRIVTVHPPDRLAAFAFGGDPLTVVTDNGWLPPARLAELRAQSFVRSARRTDTGLDVVVADAGTDRSSLESFFRNAELAVGSIEPYAADFDEIFVRIIEADTEAAQRSAA